MIDTPMNDLTHSRARLYHRLEELEIATTTVAYPAHTTVEEGKRLRGEMAGTFTKNLLVRDKQRTCFLIVVQEDIVLDLKGLVGVIGAHRSLSFTSAEQMTALLGVSPGALTPMALINNEGSDIRVVIDASLMDADQVNFHPLVNTESLGIRPNDLLRFIRSTGHEPILVPFTPITS